MTIDFTNAGPSRAFIGRSHQRKGVQLLLIVLLAAPLLLPALWRLTQSGLSQMAGLASDLATMLLLLGPIWLSPRIIRFIPLLCWCLFQIASRELYCAVRRLPSWQDAGYLSDTTFLQGSMDGLHLAAPWFAVTLLTVTVVAAAVPVHRCRARYCTVLMLIGLAILPLHHALVRASDNQDIAGRYQALHWFVADAISGIPTLSPKSAAPVELPPALSGVDLHGTTLLPSADTRQRRNVLLVVLEGIPGLYIPDIRQAAGDTSTGQYMPNLAEATKKAMLVPDFVDHSHQTIRGLYAMHCGDLSKLSYRTPKAFELQNAPERAAQCLPTQLAQHGWQTHYLQGAPLAFMNKDRAMPTMGFQEVHGLEWFTERRTTDFIWGTSDDDFFRGAATYVKKLQQQEQPWFLSLLTVATHQPYAASDEAVRIYGSRQAAAVALLDQAVTRFVTDLKASGVLENTLVIITSDESHGAEGAAWYTSWGLAMVLAPEQPLLPRLKKGTYGLVDIEASILDYLSLPVPPAVLGRSLFRDYDRNRAMLSYTGGFLRLQDADGRLHECSRDKICRTASPAGIIMPRPIQFQPATAADTERVFALAEQLDTNVSSGASETLHFASGELRSLPQAITNDWTDNLIGAQYLDFPAGSTVTVDIDLEAVDAPPEGLLMKLVLRQFEKEIGSPVPPVFPLLHTGQACRVSFSFNNEKPRQAFSFHLLGAGTNAQIRINRFDVSITTAS